MTPLQPPAALLDFLSAYPRYLVAGHEKPDGDCVGSQLALAAVLRRLGKEAICCSAGPFKRQEIRAVENLFVSKPSEVQRSDAAVILVDCSHLERTGDLEPYLHALPLAIIDHHSNQTPASALAFIDPQAPSVTFMIEALIGFLGLTPTRYEAEWLFLGLCTDTGFFRHVSQGGQAVFACAARLAGWGANPKASFDAIHSGRSLNSRILMGLILSRTTAYYQGRLLVSYETLADTERFGLENRDSDLIYQQLQAVAGVQAVMLVRQETAQNCSVGLRSRGSLRVDRIAARFGGGGHHQAAGLSLAGELSLVIPELVKAFDAEFCKNL